MTHPWRKTCTTATASHPPPSDPPEPQARIPRRHRGRRWECPCTSPLTPAAAAAATCRTGGSRPCPTPGAGGSGTGSRGKATTPPSPPSAAAAVGRAARRRRGRTRTGPPPRLGRRCRLSRWVLGRAMTSVVVGSLSSFFAGSFVCRAFGQYRGFLHTCTREKCFWSCWRCVLFRLEGVRVKVATADACYADGRGRAARVARVFHVRGKRQRALDGDRRFCLVCHRACFAVVLPEAVWFVLV